MLPFKTRYTWSNILLYDELDDELAKKKLAIMVDDDLSEDEKAEKVQGSR